MLTVISLCLDRTEGYPIKFNCHVTNCLLPVYLDLWLYEFMLKGGSGVSTNYVLRCTKNPKGGGSKTKSKSGCKSTPCPPEINPDYMFVCAVIPSVYPQNPVYMCLGLLWSLY